MRITSVLAVLLAGVLFVFPVVFGVRSDERTNTFLASPGVREKFEKAADSKAKPSEDRASPLLQQAEAFALYLNPPKTNVSAARKQPKAAGILPAMPVTTPKFKVFATSYFEDNPEMSLALIDEPGRGRHWVRQSSAVGHLVIEQVRDGLVVVRSNEETFEVAIEQNPETAPAKPIPAVSTPKGAPSRSRPTLPTSTRASAATIPAGRSRSLPEQPGNTERDAKLQELARQLIDVQKNSASEKSGSGLSQDEKTTRTLELISQYRAAQRSARVSPKEAKKLGDLGQTLEDAGPEPNQALPAAGEGKVEAGPIEPNRSREE
ncbi:MAG: hypothetical protein JSW66_00180 [Phycisphaerales bacterium]|nr:MAG: hypothetical protein JSW66_00180 [Phycisphaerales bacterium]